MSREEVKKKVQEKKMIAFGQRGEEIEKLIRPRVQVSLSHRRRPLACSHGGAKRGARHFGLLMSYFRVIIDEAAAAAAGRVGCDPKLGKGEKVNVKTNGTLIRVPVQFLRLSFSSRCHTENEMPF